MISSRLRPSFPAIGTLTREVACRALDSVVSWIRRLEGIGVSGTSVHAEVIAAVRCLPQSGAIVFDLGAATGAWTTELLRQAGSRVCAIYAFEPAPSSVARLLDLSIPCLSVIPCAVGRAVGEVALYSDAPGSELASVYPRRLDHFGIAFHNKEVVAQTTLDAFAEEKGIERIDFLKMDIEGGELAAIDGASRLLSARRIRALSFEFGGTQIDSRTFLQDFYYRLGDHGFRIYRILPSGALLPIRRYREDLESFVTTNYIAELAEVGS